MTNTFLYCWSFIFGLLFGSFLNVLILRDDRRFTIWTGRSECPHCHRMLRWYELVPVVSFLLQGGKCRGCKKPISWQYPLVELTMGIVAVGACWYGAVERGSWLLTGSLFVSMLLFVAVAGIDIMTMTVPLDYTVAAGVVGALGQGLSGNVSFTDLTLGCVVGAGSIIAVILLWKAVTRKDGMGSGDIWVAGAVGAAVGYPLVVVSLITAVYAGAIVGIAAIILKKKQLGSQVPFGPFLVFGGAVALLYGERVIHWYLNLSGMIY